jgi:hypothetical protein
MIKLGPTGGGEGGGDSHLVPIIGSQPSSSKSTQIQHWDQNSIKFLESNANQVWVIESIIIPS